MLEPSFLCISFFVTIHIFSHFPIVVDFIYSNFLYRESISYLWNELQIFSSVLSFSFYLAYRRCCHVGTVLSGKIYQLFYDWVLYSTSCLSHSKIIKQFVCWVFFPWCFCDFILSLKYDPLQFVSVWGEWTQLHVFFQWLTICPSTIYGIFLMLPSPFHLKCHLYYTL